MKGKNNKFVITFVSRKIPGLFINKAISKNNVLTEASHQSGSSESFPKKYSKYFFLEDQPLFCVQKTSYPSSTATRKGLPNGCSICYKSEIWDLNLTGCGV